MASIIANVCLLIACCGLFIIASVESNGNIANGKVVFQPYGFLMRPPSDSHVLHYWKEYNGSKMYTPPESRTYSEDLQNRKRDGTELLFVPLNTHFNPASDNHGLQNWVQYNGTEVFIPPKSRTNNEVVHNQKRDGAELLFMPPNTDLKPAKVEGERLFAAVLVRRR